MYIQVIKGKTNDPAGLQRQSERWDQDIRPGAKGYLGRTGGIADDGTALFMARFESEAAAKANSERPEQGEWWNETSKYFDGEPTFRNCTEADTTLGGGSDEAGFVQVMQGRCSDPDKLRALEAEFMPRLQEMRPDVLGSVRAWDGNEFTEAIYFTSEADARAGEKKMGENQSAADDMAEYNSLIQDLTFVDLKDPWLK